MPGAEQREFVRSSVAAVLHGAPLHGLDLSDTFEMSERVVEVPWFASKIRPGLRILDIGISLASPEHLDLLRLLSDDLGCRISAIDIIDPEKVMGRFDDHAAAFIRSIDVLVADVSESVTGVRDGFDVITCISTLEYIGFDRPRSSAGRGVFERAAVPPESPPSRPSDVEQRVLRNFRTLLRPGGTVLLSVPCGQGGPVPVIDSLGLHTFEFEYDIAGARGLMEVDGFTGEELLVYEKRPGFGWRSVTSLETWEPKVAATGTSAGACAMMSLQRQ